MQIHFPDDSEDFGAPNHVSTIGKNRVEIDAMITDGFESGPATPMTADDWQRLHDRIDERSRYNS